MLKSILRILALFALAMALITAVLDLTRSIADSTVVMTPLGIDWYNFSADTLNRARDIATEYLHPLVWDPVMQTVLQAPSWFVFGVLWFLLALAGRKRKSRWQDRYSD